jgi:DNA polymerase-3 subunit alpha/error-prone DNA polymerase
MIEIVPVEKASMVGRYVIQWNKDDVATLGLMKIDVLSLGMLSCLRKCLDLLRTHKNIQYNLATLPEEDPTTYDMIQKADTVGTFQIESRAQMATLPRLKPKNFYDLVVEVAIVRPGPLQGGMVHPYLRRRAGLEKVFYPHPNLEKVLHRTMGVPIFQEQIMRMVVEVANFTPGEADELRRIMALSWRKKAVIDGLRDRIMRGLLSNGITPEYAEQIYKTIEGFASYGFPESHAASFALLTYASCYIKCHHPDVFLCGLLNSQPMGFYSPRSLIMDAQRHGVKLLPLDIQKSNYDYTLESSEILHDVRVGLRSIHGIPETIVRDIEAERTKNGLYKNLEDFIRRTHIPRSGLMKLASAGAFDCFALSPRELLWHLQSVSLDQNSFLWGKALESFGNSFDEDIPEETEWEALGREYKSKGYSIHRHPMSLLRPWLEEKNRFLKKSRRVHYTNSEEQKKIRHGQRVRVSGLLSITQKPPTAKGFCFLTVEDELGFFNIVIPPKVYEKDRTVIYTHSLLEIQGTLENVSNVINIKAEKIVPLIEDREEKLQLPKGTPFSFL